jgi:hypothetical protein
MQGRWLGPEHPAPDCLAPARTRALIATRFTWTFAPLLRDRASGAASVTLAEAQQLGECALALLERALDAATATWPSYAPTAEANPTAQAVTAAGAGSAPLRPARQRPARV